MGKNNVNSESMQLLNEISTGVVRWISIEKASKILVVECGVDDYMYRSRQAVTESLLEEGYTVIRENPLKLASNIGYNYPEFDLALVLGVLETAKEPGKIINSVRCILRTDGRMLLATGNRFALKGFCGDQDPFTGRIFDGIDGYASVSTVNWNYLEGKLLADYEIRKLLSDSGWNVCGRLSVFPDIRYPQLLLSDGVFPNERLESRLFPLYEHPDSVWVSERKLIDQISKSGMLHKMADGYLYECSIEAVTGVDSPVNNLFHDVTSVTLSLDRGEEKACATIIHGKESVEKRALHPKGKGTLRQLKANHEYLKDHGVKIVEVQLEDKSCIMPYMDDENGMTYFSKLLEKGREPFLEALDKFVEIIRASSDIVENEVGEKVLAKGFVDLVPLNAFVRDEEFIFFDQEFVLSMCPAELIISRTLTLIVSLGSKVGEFISYEELYARYGLPLYGGKYTKMAEEWHDELKNQKLLGDFRRSHSEDDATVATNRSKANFSIQEYNLKFVDIFRDFEKISLYVFGTGIFALKFLEKYAHRYAITALVDNDKLKQGKVINGIKVISPDKIPINDRTRVIICVKQYKMIHKQLEKLGISEICMFDPNVVIIDPKFEKEQAQREANMHLKNGNELENISDKGCSEEMKTELSRRYHIGYISGVFDLFHVGHLNLLERAKSMCDYLIVGVVSDEAVRRDKNIEPTIPFEDRLRIVQSIQFVDEAHMVPIEAPTPADAWKRYHFDVQFRGSDYAENEGSKKDREFLRKHGAELVIFPYTDKVSSTKLRAIVKE